MDVLNQPGGVALDSSGTLYLADYGNSRIRKGTETAEGVTRDQPAPAIAVLAGGLEDSLQFYAFAEMDARKISSTNVLERLNKEIRRRNRVVGVFPSEESYVRLLCCYLIEHTEDWEHEKNYIRKEGLDLIKARREEAA